MLRRGASDEEMSGVITDTWHGRSDRGAEQRASLESRGTLGKVPIFGWDVTPPFLDAVVAGNVIGLVQQQPKEEGRIAVESALKVLGGGSVPKLIPVPVVLVTKDNVQDVKKSLGA